MVATTSITNHIVSHNLHETLDSISKDFGIPKVVIFKTPRYSIVPHLENKPV